MIYLLKGEYRSSWSEHIMSIEQILLSVSVSLITGLLLTRVFKSINLPDVTAYLVGGVLIGTFCLGRFVLSGYSIGFNDSISPVTSFTIISNVALGFIAFDIGNEFRLENLKKTGKKVAIIAVCEGVAAALIADIALLAAHFIILKATGTDYLPITACIILGAIASATAPAATLMVVRQYKAKGALTDLLLQVVALDDAVCLIVFAISFGVAKALYGGTVDVISVAVEPLIEIVLSLVLGAISGLILSRIEKIFHSRSNRLTLIIAFTFLTVVLAHLHYEIGSVTIGFSPLLTCMMFGTVFCNVCETSKEMMERTERWTKPLFMLFFVISGASLDLSVFRNPIFIIIGFVYIIFRSSGKILGATVSSKALGCDKSVTSNLGLALLPQAGVALGMVSTVASDETFGNNEIGSTVRFVILFAVLVYEIFGPVITKTALTRAGNITAKAEGTTARVINN